jgi:hypothetical protein
VSLLALELISGKPFSSSQSLFPTPNLFVPRNYFSPELLVNNGSSIMETNSYALSETNSEKGVILYFLGVNLSSILQDFA